MIFQQCTRHGRLQDRIGARRAATQVPIAGGGQVVSQSLQDLIDCVRQLLRVLQAAGAVHRCGCAVGPQLQLLKVLPKQDFAEVKSLFSSITNKADFVTGTWEGNRTGIFREGKGYGGFAKGDKGEGEVGSYDTYRPLVPVLSSQRRCARLP